MSVAPARGSSLPPNRAHRVLEAQRQGWPRPGVDRRKETELEGFMEQETLELDWKAIHATDQFYTREAGGSESLRRRAWSPQASHADFSPPSPMAPSSCPPQATLGKITVTKIAVCQVSFEVPHPH